MQAIKWKILLIAVLALVLGYALFAKIELISQPREELRELAPESGPKSATTWLAKEGKIDGVPIAAKAESTKVLADGVTKRVGAKMNAAELDQVMRERTAELNLARFEAALAGNADESMRVYMMLETCSYRDRFSSGPMQHFCSGVTAAMIAARHDLLSLAAESGAVEARLAYARSIHSRYSNLENIVKNADEALAARNTAMRYLNESVQSGSPEALMALSNEYYQGFLVERDVVLSRAYRYAASLTGKHPLANTQALMGADYDPADLATIEQLGRDIFERCCK